MAETRNREQVYDEEIFPLMKQILDLCTQHKIPMLAHFAIPIPNDNRLCVTSALLGPDYLAPLPTVLQQDMLAALSIVKDGFIAYAVPRRT